MSVRKEDRVETELSRRDLLQTTLGAAAGALVPAALAGEASAEEPGPMTFEGVVAEARRLAAAPYRPRPDDLPPALAALTYDDYRAITFRPEASPRLGRNFSAQLFHRGFLQRKRVDLFLQPKSSQPKSPQPNAGPPRPIAYESRLFDLGSALAGQSFPADLGFAGFRLHYAFDAAPAAPQEEFLVFLGASYFRLRGKGQEYGLSARGAAVGTGLARPEEFPDFTAFWICEPEDEARAITVFALLDSPSLAGAYRFLIEPGDPSRMTVAASLHPRDAIERLGLAPLTSMFLHGQNGPGARGAKPFDDFRPQVHDSDGLAVATTGDRLWRPLVNGRPGPQVSAFQVEPLVGFGLLQRERTFAGYLDVQARHEIRPGLWVAPVEAGSGVVPEDSGGPPRTVPRAGGPFAAGAIQLFEIPSLEEYMDNVVAAFVPREPVTAGTALALDYTLTTVGPEPDAILPGRLARVVSTRVGSAERLRPTHPPSPGRRLYAIDFEGGDLPGAPDAPVAAAVQASAGAMVDPFIERVPQTGGWRLYVEWRPPDPIPPGDVVLRARLTLDGRPISETWDAVA